MNFYKKFLKIKPTRALVLCLSICLLLAACGRRNPEESVSAGQLDKVGCFLFIFDNRSAQQQLVRDMDDGKIPTRMTCQLYDVVRDVEGNETEVPVEGHSIDTTDQTFIKRVYYAITDLIVVGQMGIQDNPTRCRMEFDLADGQKCDLIFQSNATILIGGQNYMLESSGRLWDLLEVIY